MTTDARQVPFRELVQNYATAGIPDDVRAKLGLPPNKVVGGEQRGQIESKT